MTEMEKMLAGERYDYSDPEVVERNSRAHERLERLNRIPHRDTAAYRNALRELIPGIPDSSSVIAPFFCDFGFRIRIGEYVVINYGCTLLDCGGITVGDHTLIGPGCRICTPQHPITIGEDCWLGAGVTVCPGVRIGARSIIGAGSVVVHDIPEDSLAAGNPAVVKRKLR